MIAIDLFITEKCIRDSGGPDYDLDDAKVEDWIDTILSSIMAYGIGKEYRILIHAPESLTSLDISQVQKKLKEFHHIHTIELKNQLMVMRIQTRNAVSKGIPIMIVALSTNFFIEDIDTKKTYWEFILKESMYIVGWVSMWKPIELTLYDRWPLNRKLKAYDKMLTVPINIVNT
ncbi:MAG: hypothetical protein H7259_06145 [Cytophagales bacterium]|nr:hypothetical protein [Cytophaga sp.]